MAEELANKTIAVLLAEAKGKRGISDRAMAEEIGVAHTTIARIWEGRGLDIDTIRKVADWLEVDAASLLAAEGFGTNELANKVSAVLESNPQLAEVFGEAMSRLLSGQMSPDTFREWAAYTAYRFNLMDKKLGDVDAHTGEEPGSI